ncbi:MAG: cyclic pyranopterin monophosphate synthase MoaC, partial [Syntrophorhabdaceae bacterium]|nr:cyclic pyranopterin monophosphate synthase MoaC [Syntrophorhabdaceae bacterium]
MEFTHLDEKGRAQMVDITDKKVTVRMARAYGRVMLSEKTYNAIREGYGPKGDIFSVAKIAGIMAAKNTHELIPLCHPLSITHIDVDFTFKDDKHFIEVISTVKTSGQTGVEMEAL